MVYKSEEQCCVVSCENPIDGNYWESQYQEKTTNWDLGTISPPLKMCVAAIKDKNSRILIPGCGNSYEADYLLENGFKNITVIDIAPTLVSNLKEKYKDNSNIKIVLGDFFVHNGRYDFILEQTFFCAIPPTMRQKYVWKTHQLLANKGILTGLLFDRNFDISPPFGGNKKEYNQLFSFSFKFLKFDSCLYSVSKRENSELIFEFQKNQNVAVNLYQFKGITCSGCMESVSQKILELEGVLNVSMNTSFSELLITSTSAIPLEILQSIVSYDENYIIIPF